MTPGFSIPQKEKALSSSCPLVGMASEYQRLMTALRKRQPLLILGPGGSGKSALIASVLADFPWPNEVISVQHSPNLHHLLVDLARSLIKIDHDVFQKLAKPGDNPEKWLAQQTSVHLKGILWTALEAKPYPIVLDGVTGGGFPMYRFLQRLYFAKGMALFAAARDPVALGALARLFWDPRHTIHLSPLSDADANRLFDEAVSRFHIGNLDIEEFRGKVLEAAKGNPGQLIEMCRLASDPRYVTGTHIKFAPLRIDALMRFL